jgi:hypothetical protein
MTEDDVAFWEEQRFVAVGASVGAGRVIAPITSGATAAFSCGFAAASPFCWAHNGPRN